MRTVLQCLPFAGLIAGGFITAVACNNGPGLPQAIIASNIQPATTPPNENLGCNAQGKFVWVPEQSTNPVGPDTSDNTLVTATGTADIQINCSVIPSNGNFNVLATTELTNPVTGGTLTIQGVFTPRARAADDSGTPTSDSTTIPNITVDFQSGTFHLHEADCFAQYVTVVGAAPGTSLPKAADTYADSNGGRIWASVFCNAPVNEDEQQKPGNKGCMMYATFRFENCTSHT